ncbi:hypothetical protein QTP88_016213 [Uroleucon formosanum]
MKFVANIHFFYVAIVTSNKEKKLSDEEVAELLQGDISDLEELDEGDDINTDNLNEMLNQFPDNIEELYPMQNNLLEEDEVNFENNLIMLNQRDIESEIEEENRLFNEQVRIDPNWEKVPYQNPDSTWKGNYHILSPYEYFKQYFDDENMTTPISNLDLLQSKLALASKTLPEELIYTLKQSVKIVNAIKSSALNTRIFKIICSDSEYETLLFHTEVRWLSKGNMLARLFSLKEEVTVFLTEKKMIDLLKGVCDHKFEMHLAYLVDIFEHLNKLNLQLQGSGNHKLEGAANIFIFKDKLLAFICKINLWISKVEINNYSTFQTLKSIVDNEKYADFVPEVQKNVLHHLHKLKDEFNRYFPEYNGYETKGFRSMIRNPFIVKVDEVDDDIQEDLIELQNDRNCKDTFESSMNIEEF